MRLLLSFFYLCRVFDTIFYSSWRTCPCNLDITSFREVAALFRTWRTFRRQCVLIHTSCCIPGIAQDRPRTSFYPAWPLARSMMYKSRFSFAFCMPRVVVQGIFHNSFCRLLRKLKGNVGRRLNFLPMRGSLYHTPVCIASHICAAGFPRS